MYLRSGKNTIVAPIYSDMFMNDISFIHSWYFTKGKCPSDYDYKNVIRCVCNLYFASFIIKAKHYYGKELVVSFEADYRITTKHNLKKYQYIYDHISRIEYLVKTFLASEYYRGTHTYYQIMIVLLAIVFHYFQMVIIETLYNDCLMWKDISKLLGINNDFVPSTYKDNIRIISLAKTFYYTLWFDLAFSDDTTCAFIRQYLLSL